MFQLWITIFLGEATQDFTRGGPAGHLDEPPVIRLDSTVREPDGRHLDLAAKRNDGGLWPRSFFIGKPFKDGEHVECHMIQP